MKLDRVVPWGRNLAEYQAMFSLTEADGRECCILLQQAQQQCHLTSNSHGQLVSNIDLTNFPWDTPNLNQLHQQLLMAPILLDEIRRDLTPHRLILHLKTLADSFHSWNQSPQLTAPISTLLLDLKNHTADWLTTFLQIKPATITNTPKIVN